MKNERGFLSTIAILIIFTLNMIFMFDIQMCFADENHDTYNIDRITNSLRSILTLRLNPLPLLQSHSY